MQYGHLRQHAIACLVYHDAARSIENSFVDYHAATNWQTVHEAAVTRRVFEPRLSNAPVIEFVTQFLIFDLVALVLR